MKLVFLFPGYDSDTDESYETDIKQCYATTTVSGTTTTTAKNGAGRRSELLKNKNKQKIRLKLFSPLSYFNTLIPNGLDVGIKIYLTSSKTSYWQKKTNKNKQKQTEKIKPPYHYHSTDERFFVTKVAGNEPKLVIKDACMYFECLLLRETVLSRIAARLNSSPLQINFKSIHTKTWTLDQGTIDKFLNITLKVMNKSRHYNMQMRLISILTKYLNNTFLTGRFLRSSRTHSPKPLSRRILWHKSTQISISQPKKSLPRSRIKFENPLITSRTFWRHWR